MLEINIGRAGIENSPFCLRAEWKRQWYEEAAYLYRKGIARFNVGTLDPAHFIPTEPDRCRCGMHVLFNGVIKWFTSTMVHIVQACVG
jgi:hypothetical protein